MLPIPKYSVLVNVRYTSFMDALRDANALMAHKPLSIETVDSKVLMLAMKDIVWHSVADYFPADPERPTLGINLVEFCGDQPDEVNARVQAFIQHLQSDTSVERLGHTLAEGAEDEGEREPAVGRRTERGQRARQSAPGALVVHGVQEVAGDGVAHRSQRGLPGPPGANRFRLPRVDSRPWSSSRATPPPTT